MDKCFGRFSSCPAFFLSLSVFCVIFLADLTVFYTFLYSIQQLFFVQAADYLPNVN